MYSNPDQTRVGLVVSLDFGASPVFALLWNMAQSQLPKEVHQDFQIPIHDEVQPHKWAFSWTTSRAAGFPDRPELYCPELHGLYCILTHYGIRVKAARDTLVVRVPHDEHGTSLLNIALIILDTKQMDDIPMLQQGAAIVTSPRLMGVWHKYEKQDWLQEVEDAAQKEYALLGHGGE
ncbi:hypothetical protein CERSUDRAFT_70032 [Gelatoporia subvermispora B]|uniref:Uncharacterized protein n=1 Tax=Ceriporiopsis subvermispora (strain B) TaxID=914234 RepID=M2RSS2_CERS8|nr:hypothetical protein CERSUDRAFT_70032 [Gelatoporia subvermispora B]